MRASAFVLCLLALAVATGCSKTYLDYKYGEIKPSLASINASMPGGNGVALNAWHPYSVVAISNAKGEICPLPPDGAKMSRNDAAFGLSAAGIGTLPAIGASGSSSRADTFNITTSDDPRVAIAENNMSSLCIMRMNGWIDNATTAELFRYVVWNAAGMSVSGSPDAKCQAAKVAEELATKAGEEAARAATTAKAAADKAAADKAEAAKQPKDKAAAAKAVASEAESQKAAANKEAAEKAATQAKDAAATIFKQTGCKAG